MSRHTSLRAFAAALGVAGALSCTPMGTEVIGEHAARGEIFDSYVAIGNSITMGFMSGGVIDTSQKRSYAFLLAQAMGTRYSYPSIAGRGCPPLIVSFLTQARPTGTTSTTCDLRANQTDILNNVAVSGAWSGDPTSTSTTASNALTTIVLGGKTQVQKALDAKPTFVSIWIGNNDLLGPAISSGGTSQIGPTSSLNAITSQAQFTTNIDAIVNPLVAANPGLKGVMIGVVNVKNAPVMFPASALPAPGASNTFKQQFDAIACGASTSPCFGTVTTVHSSCVGSTSMINTFLAFTIRTQTPSAHPALIACSPGAVPGTAVGDAFVLDANEQATIDAAVTGFNNTISTKATAVGFAYWDPNPFLAASRTAGTVIRNTPLYTSATAPFGSGMSLDGVHPAASVHIMVADSVRKVINTKYGTTLPTIF
jgi:GDSL-like lipase/acylhydrolase family protein